MRNYGDPGLIKIVSNANGDSVFCKVPIFSKNGDKKGREEEFFFIGLRGISLFCQPSMAGLFKYRAKPSASSILTTKKPPVFFVPFEKKHCFFSS